MLGRSVLVVGLVAVGGLAATHGVAYREAPFQLHLLLALGSTLLALFAHSFLTLYLLATGRLIRATAAARQLGAEPAQRASRLRRQSLPWALAASVLWLATFGLGGLAYTFITPLWVHHAAAWLTALVQVVALHREWTALRANHQLMAELAPLA